MDATRRSGILMHVTSLPGKYGVGTLDQTAYEWVDFLESTRQTLWQVLPLGPTGYGDSPYQSFSTFAGNPYLIGLDLLVEEGLLQAATLATAPALPDDRVDYGALYNWKLPLLREVAAAFYDRANAELVREFHDFALDNRLWLDDYALFMAIKDAHDGKPWVEWEMALRSRDADAIAAATVEHAAAIHGWKVMQWLFFRQWLAIKAYANDRGIKIVGDIPIFVAMDSADAWTNPDEFYLDDTFQPTVVAGVPPDYFSATGQLWGNPLYRWDVMQREGYRWWVARIRGALRLYDLVRIDHFRGFAGYWEIPAGEPTAEKGQWVKGPGADLFDKIRLEFGVDMPIIAEDLGEITPDVIELRNGYGLPGMKILQFSFSTDATDKFLPHNYERNFVVYTGTHDNDTSWGWYRTTATAHERDHFRKYFGTDGHDAAWTLIGAAWASVALYALAPMQDFLDLDGDARMNLPGRADGNWTWRLQTRQMKGGLAARLKEMTLLYGRDPLLFVGKDAEAGGQEGKNDKGAGASN